MTLTNSIDLSDLDDAKLELWRFVDRAVDDDEGIRISISTNGGTSWTQIWEWTENTDDDDRTWYDESYTLSSGQLTSTFKIKIEGETSAYGEENAIDDVRITSDSIPIVDTTAPVIILNPPTVLELQYNAVFTEPGYDAQDDIDGNVTSSVVITGTVNTSTLGTYTLNYDVDDAAGNSAVTKTRTVNVIDSIIPTFTSTPANYTSEATAVLTPLNATDYGSATASDNYDANPLVTSNATATFLLGDTIIKWLAIDSSNNTSSALQTITIQDTITPLLSVPADFIAEATAFFTPLNSTDYGLATATDIFSVTINNDSDGTFELGNNTLTWIATDTSGNTVSANQTITIQDTMPPTINAASTAALEATSFLTLLNTTGYVYPAVADNHSTSLSHDGPSAFPLGNTTVTWSVSDDSGNVASTNQTIIIQDTAPLTILNLVTPYFLEASAVHTLLNSTGYVSPTVTDNYDVSPTLTGNLPTVLPFGDTVVVWTSSDTNGNSVTSNQTITVQDTMPPVVTAPADYTAEATAILTPLNSTDFGTATATDIFPVTISNDSTGSFALGNNTVTWSATDDNGNTATANQSVTIQDTTMPIITAPSDYTVALPQNQTSISLNSTDYGTSTATDIFAEPLLIMHHCRSPLATLLLPGLQLTRQETMLLLTKPFLSHLKIIYISQIDSDRNVLI